MTNAAITDLVGAVLGVFGLAAFAWLVMVPAVRSYPKTWERVAAAFLSLYVLAAFVGVGALGGIWVALWVWPRVFG